MEVARMAVALWAPPRLPLPAWLVLGGLRGWLGVLGWCPLAVVLVLCPLPS